MEKICDIDLIINKEKKKIPIISYNLYTIVPNKPTNMIFPLYIFDKFVSKSIIERAKNKLSDITKKSLGLDDFVVVEFRNKDIRFEVSDSNKIELSQHNSYSFPLIVRIEELEKYKKFVKCFIVHSYTYTFYKNLSKYGCTGRQLFPGISYCFDPIKNNSNIDISNFICYKNCDSIIQQGQVIGKILEDNLETRINKPGHVYFNRRWYKPRIYLGSVKVSSRFKNPCRYDTGFFFYKYYSSQCSQSFGKPRDYFINLDSNSLIGNIENYLKAVKGKDIGEAVSTALNNTVTDAIDYFKSPEKAVDLGKLLVVNNKSDNPEDIIYQKIKDSFNSDSVKETYRYLGVLDNKDLMSNKKQWTRLLKTIKADMTPEKVDKLYSKNYIETTDTNICKKFIDQFGYTKDEFKKLLKI